MIETTKLKDITIQWTTMDNVDEKYIKVLDVVFNSDTKILDLAQTFVYDGITRYIEDVNSCICDRPNENITTLNLSEFCYDLSSSWNYNRTDLAEYNEISNCFPNLMNVTINGNLNTSITGFEIRNGIMYEAYPEPAFGWESENYATGWAICLYPCARCKDKIIDYSCFDNTSAIRKMAFLDLDNLTIPNNILRLDSNCFTGTKIKDLTIKKNVIGMGKLITVSGGNEYGYIDTVHCYKGSLADNINWYNNLTNISYVIPSNGDYYVNEGGVLKKVSLNVKNATDIVGCTIFIK